MDHFCVQPLAMNYDEIGDNSQKESCRELIRNTTYLVAKSFVKI